MGLEELFKNSLGKFAKQKDKIIAKKDEVILKKEEALLKERENTVVNSFNNGISIPMIVNITNLSSKEVKAILKKKGLL